MIKTYIMNPITQEPQDNQHVLIDLGNYVHPATYRARTKTFNRFSDNCHPGDRCLSYFYSGVVGWYPFPEPSGKSGFIAEQEKPVQQEPIILGETTTSGTGNGIYVVDIETLRQESYKP